MTDLAYLNTRICSRRVDLLSRESIEAMVSASDLGVIVDHLLEGPYGVELARALPSHPHLRAIEEALAASLNTCLADVTRMAGSDEAEWIWRMVEGWDIQCLKTVIRGLHAQMLSEDTLRAVGPGARLRCRHLEELAGAPDVRAAVELLCTWSMPWGRVLVPLLQQYLVDRDCRPLEYALDCHRFRSASPGGNGGENGRLVAELLEEEKEITNIVLCLLFLDREEEPSLVPEGGPRSPLERALCAAHDLDAAMTALADSPYQAVLDRALPLITASGRFTMLERLFDERLLRHSRALAMEDPLSAAVPCHYLRCKRNEIMNLRLIAHAIETGLPASAVQFGLVFVP